MTFEQKLARTMAERRAFAAECQELFRTPVGQRVLARLCAAANPLGPRVSQQRPDPILAAVEDGRREVVGTLWAYGAGSPAPPPTTDATSEEENRETGADA